MNFKGRFEEITEATLTRYQQGGIMVGDIVKIKSNALKHPKLKDVADNLKGNIQVMMDTDLHLSVTGLRSIRDSRGDMSDGLGLASTTAPTDFWVDVAVLHSPGLKSDPITIPIEVVERQDFGASLPPTPDSLIRKGNVNIKPEEVENLLPTKNTVLKTAKKAVSESIEDVYDTMSQPTAVTVRVPLDDTDEVKTALDGAGITYSVIGTNRYELHGIMDAIQSVLNTINSGCGCDGMGMGTDIEYVGGGNELPNQIEAPIEISTEPDNGTEENSLEEAYSKIHSGEDRESIYTIEIPNAFADNVKTYLTSEGINNMATIDGNKTYIDIVTKSDEDTILENIKQHVMGDLTYLKVYKSNQQLSEV